MNGFKAEGTEPFDLAVDSRQRVNIKLVIGATSDSVTVSDAAGLLETDNSSRGQVINAREIADLPLNGRAYADLTLLVPGVAKSLLENGTDSITLPATSKITMAITRASTTTTPVLSGALSSYNQPFNDTFSVLYDLPVVHKSFAISEARYLQFRAEAFNLLNKTNFATVSGTNSNSSGFGVFNATFPARQIQLALKLVF
jgi:hypothetical protein